MVIVYHDNRKVEAVYAPNKQLLDYDRTLSFGRLLEALSLIYGDQLICWCYAPFRTELDTDYLEMTVTKDKMISFRPGLDLYFGPDLGYCDESLFVNVNKHILYPTWQMSAAGGAVYSEIIKNSIGFTSGHHDPDYYLSSLAKQNMPVGLLCYSDPKLFENAPEYNVKCDRHGLFAFVKEHYRFRWVWLLFINLGLYEKRLFIFPVLNCLFTSKLPVLKVSPVEIKYGSISDDDSVDVIIPTIGRKQYLHDFLVDLSVQSHRPSRIIIVEQNPNAGAISELDFISSKEWPFTIEHTFTSQPGACNARNIALQQVRSKWVFFADDDIRIDKDFLKEAIGKMKGKGTSAASFECLQEGQNPVYHHVIQWYGFGSGCSIVSSDRLNNKTFGIEYEFGFGEDADFGMQLRQDGTDILYLPAPSILHLKAPIGGFRSKPVLLWSEEKLPPKPSPTVMVYLQRYYTRQQLDNYKTTLLIKYYPRQAVKNPVRYFRRFKEQWNISKHWAQQLTSADSAKSFTP